MKQVVNGKLYDTDKARLVASDRYWDGHNWERHGRNTYLYKTANSLHAAMSGAENDPNYRLGFLDGIRLCSSFDRARGEQ